MKELTGEWGANIKESEVMYFCFKYLLYLSENLTFRVDARR